MALEKWSTTAGSNVNSNTGINWDEGMPPSAVNDSARSTMSELRDWYENAEWPIYGRNGGSAYSISFVSTTVFKFAGTDRRTLVPVGRRVKAGVGAGTIYGECTAVTLSASDTQATIAWDSGQLDSSLSYVALGIVNSANSSHPVQRDTYPHFADATDPTKKLRIDCGSISSGATRVLYMQDRDTTVLGQEDVATQTNQETGTSLITFVSPGRQQFHQSAAKAWGEADFNGSLAASYNVASVADVGTGLIRWNWNTPFSSNRYTAVPGVKIDFGGAAATTYAVGVDNTSFTASEAHCTCARVSDGVLSDPNHWMITAYGDQ